MPTAPRLRVASERDGWVYYARKDLTESEARKYGYRFLIKIGKSADPVRRCESLKAVLIACHPAGKLDEENILWRFGKYRVRPPAYFQTKEWFFPTSEMVHVLRKLSARSERCGLPPYGALRPDA